MNTTTHKKLLPQFEKILTSPLKYRFLNRKQFQNFFNHKHKNRIIIWLNYLTKEKYLIREYKKKFPEEPAVYSLGLKGKRYLEEHAEVLKINPGLLKRVYQEKGYSKKFKMHCMFVADIYSALNTYANLHNLDFKFLTKVDLTGMDNLIEEEPDAYFTLNNKKGVSRIYFLEVFDRFSDWKEVEKRVTEYFQYYEQNLWQSFAKKPFPNLILVSPDDRTTEHLQKHIKNKLTEEYYDLFFYLSSWDEIKQKGISRETLHKVGIL